MPGKLLALINYFTLASYIGLRILYINSPVFLFFKEKDKRLDLIFIRMCPIRSGAREAITFIRMCPIRSGAREAITKKRPQNKKLLNKS